MGVRNSRLGYGTGVRENNNGCVVQMASCCNPYFSTQFQSNNQSCFIKPNLLGLYKATTTGAVEQAKFSCEIPRKTFMPPVGSSPAFFAPKQTQVGHYLGARNLHLRPPPAKPMSPFYSQSSVNLQFKSPLQFQNKFYRGAYQQPSIIPMQPMTTSIATPIPNQLPNHLHNHVHAQIPQMPVHLHNHMHNALQNQIANPVGATAVAHVGANPAIVQAANTALLSLPKPNQVTLTNPQGIKFPMPLAYPYGQPLIENFNQAGVFEQDENENNNNNNDDNNKQSNSENVIVVNADI